MQMVCLKLLDEVYLAPDVQLSRRKLLCELLSQIAPESRVLCLLPEVIRDRGDFLELCLEVANVWKPADVVYTDYRYALADQYEFQEDELIGHSGFSALSQSLRVHLTSGFQDDSALTLLEVEGAAVFEWITTVIHGNYDFYYFWIAPTEELINTAMNDFHTALHKVDLAKDYPFNDPRREQACNGWNPDPAACWYESMQHSLLVTNQLQGLQVYMPQFERGAGSVVTLASALLSELGISDLKGHCPALAAEVLATLEIAGAP